MKVQSFRASDRCYVEFDWFSIFVFQF